MVSQKIRPLKILVIDSLLLQVSPQQLFGDNYEKMYSNHKHMFYSKLWFIENGNFNSR